MGERDFTIRTATESDTGLILNFIHQLAEYEKLSHEVVATEADLRRHLFGSDAPASVLLAFEGQSPVGFALFFRNFSTFLGRPGIYLEDLFIVPEARSKGYGKKLLREIAVLCEERGYGRFEWSVLDWNEPAIGFYKKLGAVPMDDWTVHRLSGDALAALGGNAEEKETMNA